VTLPWLATAAFGLEGVVARELRALGFADARAENGGARFTAAPQDALRANLWLRCADRVLLVCARFPAASFEELFEGTRALPWADWIPKDGAFPVRAHCARSQLMSARDCQAIVKKAVAERLKTAYCLQWLPETGAAYAIDVSLHGDVVQIALDASGEALNRRGYRTWNGEAPLRETLAAALVSLAPWRPGKPLHDPMCGTGTLLIEAAMQAANRAPGLRRAFACEAWAMMPACAAAEARAQAQTAYNPQAIAGISGSDISADALALAERHLRQAGLEGLVRLEKRDVADLSLPGPPGAFLTNPPYGERLGNRQGAEALYRALRALADRHPGWCLGVFTGHPGFERCYGRRADKKRRLYNGRLECEWLTFLPRRA
jgi:putative N6-adenine-specific DNA methylase